MRLLLYSFFSLVIAVTCTLPPSPPDAMTVVGSESYLDGYPARNPDGTVNVVVEIPAGTTDKWEVDKRDGALRWELKNGAPRVVRYLGYPGNYGMIPRTILPRDLGGDGDPLDAIVLGPAVPRGSVVRARAVGVLRLLDGGEQDDKLLAVQEGHAFADCEDLDELQARFPGVTTIVETWFESYKGAGELVSLGFADRARALSILEAAAEAFEAPGERGDEHGAAVAPSLARRP